MTTGVEPGAWRHYGYGGPPEPWDHDAQRDLDRLATSYYLDALESRREILSNHPSGDLTDRVDELFDDATRHKHEIDYTLRHWATPAEQARVADRLGSLMRISRKLRGIADNQPPVRPDPRRPDPLPEVA